MEGEASKREGFKRKRKKSFLKKQKQYGKKGRFGQGVQLSEDSYQYFIRILEVLNASNDSKEDKETLAANVIDEITGKEVDTCSNQLASRVIEQLLPFSPDDKLIGLATTFITELRLVCTDPYCSHVLQNISIVLTQRILKGSSEKEIVKELTTCLERISKFALNNLEDFIFDTYANHVLRTLFACVNGKPVKEDSVGVDITSQNSTSMPDCFEELSAAFTDKVASWPQLSDLTLQVLPSCCIQALLVSIRAKPKLAKKLVKKVLEVWNTQRDLNLEDDVNKPILGVIESAIVAAPPKQFKELYETLFKGKLTQLACSKNCNFVVQKLLTHCTVKEIFEGMMAELCDATDGILTASNTGVLLTMAKACRRLKTKEGDFSKNLMASLHCEEPQERRLLSTTLIYTLTRYEAYRAETTKVNLHGSLILQEMLHFVKPIRQVTSLLNMESEQLATLFCDPRGCHIADAYCSSPYVGEKNREKLFRKLEKRYGLLAASKHGSRSFEAIWSVLGHQQKVSVMEEVKAAQSAVVGTLWGKIIASKLRLDLFRTDKEGWLRQMGGTRKEDSKQKQRKKQKGFKEEK